MTVGIDASNIKTGGGVTHLKELLEFANPNKYGISKIIVYGGKSIHLLPERDWLIKKTYPDLGGSFITESFWKIFLLPKFLKQDNISILFCPGGTYIGRFRPYVTMSRNMLVFEQAERARFGFSWMRFRFKLLTYIQSYSFHHASTVIFISKYAKDYITKTLNLSNDNKVIYHGIASRFLQLPKKQKSINNYGALNPFKLLYVSTINTYKHQINVIEAVARLRKEGVPVELHLVGGGYPPELVRMKKTIKQVDKAGVFIHYHGEIPYNEMDKQYQNADGFIFASTCENMPNIVIEAMAAGLPILSSNHQPMPEFLENAAFYFNPLYVEDVYQAIKTILNSPEKRGELQAKGMELIKAYSWEKCADETFSLLATTYKNILR